MSTKLLICLLWQQLVTYSSTYVLVSLSIDRYDAITHPLNFTGSWKRAKILVMSAWALSAVFSLPAIFLYEEAVMQGRPQCWIELKPWQWKLYLPLVALSLFFIPAVIISGCYLIIVHTIWSKGKTIAFPKVKNKSKNTSNKSNANSQTNNKNDGQKYSDKDNDFKRASSRGIIPKAKIKTVKMTFVIVFVFILCWSPFFVWDLLQVWDAIPVSQTTIAISTFIQSLAPLNSAANPVIYFLFSTHFCRNIRRLSISRICCLTVRQTTQNTSRRLDYNTINSTATHSSSRTQRFSMTSKYSPNSSKNSSVKKTVVIRDVKRIQTQIQKHDSNELKLIDCSNSVV